MITKGKTLHITITKSSCLFFTINRPIFMLPSHVWSSWCVLPLLSSVIVSQWTSMLQIVAVHLQLMGLTYSVIDGTVNPKRRMDLVEEFNTNPKGPQVNVYIFLKWSMFEWSRRLFWFRFFFFSGGGGWWGFFCISHIPDEPHSLPSLFQSTSQLITFRTTRIIIHVKQCEV